MILRGLRYLSSACALFLVLVLVISSCSKREKMPAGILSQPQMVNLLSEVYVTEQKVTKTGIKYDSAKMVFERMKGKIFEKAGTSDSIFKVSFDYYVEHPKELENIYTALVDSLNLKEQQYDLKPAKTDSVAAPK